MPKPSKSTDAAERTPSEALQRRLAEIGAESETERSIKRILPWVVSLALHGGFIVLGFIITWSVVLLRDEGDPTLIVADFDAPRFDPVLRMNLRQTDLDQLSAQNRRQIDPIEPLPEDRQAEMELDPLRVISDAASPLPLTDFAPRPVEGSVRFVGVHSSNARRIVYVIDASGSMIASLQIVLDELARSLDDLSPQQSFGIVFFQQNEGLVVPPASRLMHAADEEKVRALQWIHDHIIPGGRSNPLEAIRKALSLKPDVIFLLSENITGSGQFEIDQADLLALLDELNPVDRVTGRRRTRINCIQFLDPDPLDTLRKIAREHGGDSGYKFLDRQELGIVAP